MTFDTAQAVQRRASELFTSYQRDIYKSTDRLFAGLMGFQWIAGIVFALWVSPLAWYGALLTKFTEHKPDPEVTAPV